MKEIHFKIVYNHGDANQHRLDMYDAAVSLQGFAKALAITTHALINEGEIRRKGNKAEGAQIFINPSRKGSFEELITIIINNPEATIGVSVVSNAFWDLIKWTWSKTVEKYYEPETPFVKRLNDRTEPFIGDIEEALEIPLEQAHRPIKKCEDMTISITRPRTGEVITLDAETLKSVSLQTENNLLKNIIGNVTKYNIISGIGRFYDDGIEHTVSFKIPDNFPSEKRQIFTWSMHHAQNGDGGKIELEVKRVKSAKGVLKRYLIHDVKIYK